MPYVRGTFTGERARQIARSGKVSGKGVHYVPWWPEETCEKVYMLGDAGEDWHEFTAYDSHGQVLGVHRLDGY